MIHTNPSIGYNYYTQPCMVGFMLRVPKVALIGTSLYILALFMQSFCLYKSVQFIHYEWLENAVSCYLSLDHDQITMISIKTRMTLCHLVQTRWPHEKECIRSIYVGGVLEFDLMPVTTKQRRTLKTSRQQFFAANYGNFSQPKIEISYATGRNKLISFMCFNTMFFHLCGTK
jgi:hypothetical protein